MRSATGTEKPRVPSPSPPGSDSAQLMHRHVEKAYMVAAAGFPARLALTPGKPAMSARSHTPPGRKLFFTCAIRSLGKGASWRTSSVKTCGERMARNLMHEI